MTVMQGKRSPFHVQVALEIEGRIRKGTYRPGESLPSVRSLSQEFGVSLNVIQRAIRRLEKRSVVMTHAGKGVEVLGDGEGARTAILFGFIQPYPATLHFERQVLLYADQAFATRDNLMVTRSSQMSARREVEIAEHMVHNGVQGILLWSTSQGTNVQFFERLSERVPVVLVDRLLPECNLPAVVIDAQGAGRSVAETMFNDRACSRLLVIRDDLDISPYRELDRGLSVTAAELGRESDYTVVQLPVSDLIHDWNRGDFSKIEQQRDYIARLLDEGNYDALFCQHEDFIDYAFVQMGLVDRFSHVQLATITGPDANSRTVRYHRLDVQRWISDFPRMINIAAETLQTWVLDRVRPSGVQRLTVMPCERAKFDQPETKLE